MSFRRPENGLVTQSEIKVYVLTLMSFLRFFFSWTNPYNEELSHLDRIKSVNGVLTIQNAQEQDSGNYSCHASNLAGSVSVVLPIVISGALTPPDPPFVYPHPVNLALYPVHSKIDSTIGESTNRVLCI